MVNNKPQLILIHGALGNALQMDVLAQNAKSVYDVYCFQCPYHDGKPVELNKFTIPHFSNALLNFITENNLIKPKVFGYSMGGYLALYTQQIQPVFSKIVTYGTKFNWSPEAALLETQKLQPNLIENKVPHFAGLLQAQYGTAWMQVVNATAALMHDISLNKYLPDKILNPVVIPVTILVGDNDNMVTLSETQTATNWFANAQMHKVNGQHLLHKVDVTTLLNFI
ncbi:MAG: alpha/beta fold hydrolase [Bacteroidia bacterium]|mgnify:CR=1 FL=1|nr:alpha/beta fold hydrolase [Bacteroidia bacterium]HQV00872.1 alpha/beta fold hydrolase [Bacteroidia bacterium]